MRTMILASLAAVQVLAAGSMAAQADTSVVGARVRVTVVNEDPLSGSRIVVGKLVAVGDSGISIRELGSEVDEVVPASRLQRFEVRTGPNRGAGARLGALVGLGFGAVLGFAGGENCSNKEWICFDRDETTFFGALMGASFGGLIGFLAGRGDRFAEAPLPARVTLAPTRGGAVRLGASLAFR
jgi:hypothetical protein